MGRFLRHALCDACWKEQRGGPRKPYRVLNPDVARCCNCGEATKSGIFIREDVELMKHCHCPDKDA